MFKATITEKSGRVSGDQKETREELQAWIDKEVANNSWGKPERWVRALEEGDKPKDQREVEPDKFEEGAEPVKIVEYLLPAEYTIDIQDISAKVAEEKAKLDAIKEKKDQADIHLKDIDWDKLSRDSKQPELVAIIKSLKEKVDGL